MSHKSGVNLLLLLLLVQAVLVVSGDFQYKICVDSNGGNDTNCHLADAGSYSKRHNCCQTIDQALSVATGTTASMAVYIHPGTYELQSSYERNESLGFALIGTGASDETIITCTKGVGISFYKSTEITLRNLTVQNCGTKRISTSRNITSTSYTYLEYSVAVYMLYCTDVTISNVIWSNTQANGLTLYNTAGKVIIRDSIFSYNGADMTDDDQGGGGVVIEFSFCEPGSLKCYMSHSTNVPEHYRSDSTYVIENTEFLSNKAYKGFRGVYKPMNKPWNNFNFGKGGGLSIVFKGSAQYNHIAIKNCNFDDNTAHYGAGFFVGYYDNAHANTVTISDSNITNNSNCYINKPDWDTDESGGGGKIQFSQDPLLSDNKIVINGSHFANNTAISGGALYADTSIGLPSFTLNKIHLENNTFQGNVAYLGSALYFGQRFVSVTFAFKELYLYISGCSFIENRLMCANVDSYTTLPCAGIIYSNNFNLHMAGELHFIGNQESSIELHSADCQVYSGSKLVFTNNFAANGPGIALCDCSYLTIANGTHFIFTDNRATNKGGAIFVGNCNGNDEASLTSSECFIHHVELFLHPDSWNSSFQFSNNTANDGRSSIYCLSMMPCWWPINGLIVEPEDINKTFCWEGWSYDSSNSTELCFENVASGVASITMDNGTRASLYPGQLLPVPVLKDGKGQAMYNEKLTYCVQSNNALVESSEGIGKCSSQRSLETLNGLGIKLIRTNSDSVNVRIKTSDSLSATIIVNFLPCKWPYFNTLTQRDNTTRCCIDSSFFDCNSDCCTVNDALWTSHYQYCVNRRDGELMIARCPSVYVDPLLSDNFTNIVSNCVKYGFSNRAGDFCSHCAEGFHVAINALYLECLPCSVGKSWMWFFLLEMLPLTIMVLIIFIFSIKLTKGTMYGFVFYCQMLSVSFPGWYYPAWFSQADYFINTSSIYGYGEDANVLTQAAQASFPLSIWNLNFMTLMPASTYPICPIKFNGSLGAIAFWYIIALYPLILLAMLVLWLSLYERGLKCIRFFSIRIHKVLARFWRMCGIEPSLIDSVSSVYVLCYTQLAVTSLKLLNMTKRQSLVDENSHEPVSFYEADLRYFSSSHVGYGIAAVLVLVLVVLLPTFFLILYPFNWFHRLLSCFNLKRHLWINHVVDSFAGSFKNRDKNHLLGYQYFPGLYLLLRVLILTYYYLPESRYSVLLYMEMITCLLCAGVVMIFRPFKRNLHNFINFLIFVYMGILSAIPLVSNSTDQAVREKIRPTLLVLMNLPVGLFFLYATYSALRIVSHSYRYCKEGYFSRSTRRRFLVDQENEDTDINYDSEPDTDPEDFPHRVLHPENYNATYEDTHSAPSSAENTETFRTALNTHASTVSTRLTSRASVRQSKSTGTYGSVQYTD